MKKCGRCGKDVVEEEAEICWYCEDELCYACWDDLGHCGHVEADRLNAMAKAMGEVTDVVRYEARRTISHLLLLLISPMVWFTSDAYRLTGLDAWRHGIHHALVVYILNWQMYGRWEPSN
jgi:hypothetical protein